MLHESAGAQCFIKSDRIHFGTQPSHYSITDIARGSSNSRVIDTGSKRHHCVRIDRIHEGKRGEKKIVTVNLFFLHRSVPIAEAAGAE